MFDSYNKILKMVLQIKNTNSNTNFNTEENWCNNENEYLN